MTPPRRIPMRLTPATGESFDSWLIAYAHRLDAPIADILTQAGIQQRAVRTDPRSLARGPSSVVLDQLSQVTGHTSTELAQTFRALRHYEDEVRLLQHPVRGALTGILRSSRFCPACLAATGGRWQASWRMTWVVACPEHHLLLATTCPACNALTRRRPVRTDSSPPDPWLCTEPAANQTGRNPARCGANLTTADTERVDARLVALARSWQSLDEDGHAADLVRLIADIAVLLPLVGAGEGASAAREPLHDPRLFASLLAEAAEAAMNPGGEVFARLASARLSSKSPALPAGWAGISADLATRALTTRDPHLRPLDRVRWSTTTRGRKPTGKKAEAQAQASRLPASLWPEWSLRLMPPGLTTGALFPAAGAGSLLLRGSTLSMGLLIRLLSDEPTDAGSSSRAILEVAKSEHGDDVLRSLALLAEAIEGAHPSPIDYGRRRRLANSEELITPDQWHQLCIETGAARGVERKRGYARVRLWEILTGGMARQAPGMLQGISRDPISTYYDFARRLTPQFTDALHARARMLLDGWGLADEPVTWSPPLNCITDPPFPWPGTDQARLGALLPTGALAAHGALGDIAHSYGLDLHQARLIVTLGLFAPEPIPRQRYGTPLSEEVVRDAVEHRGLTLRQTAQELGVDRKTVSRRCREIGIDLAAPGRRRTWQVDPDWIRHQYVDKGRPLPDIAQEVGCSTANIARLAKEHGIPLRSRGGVSHRSATVREPELSPLLAACLRGQGGRLRVERFHQIAASRSLNHAARQHGVAQSVLTVQLQKLEAAAGGDLVVRSSKAHQPLSLTRLGRKLLRQSTEELGLPPITSDPEPLASALGSFRGEERIAKLAIAAGQPSLRAAAAICGITPASLRGSIRGLERVTGPLVTGLAVDDPFRLTAKGARLVEQWHNTASAP